MAGGYAYLTAADSAFGGFGTQSYLYEFDWSPAAVSTSNTILLCARLTTGAVGMGYLNGVLPGDLPGAVEYSDPPPWSCAAMNAGTPPTSSYPAQYGRHEVDAYAGAVSGFALARGTPNATDYGYWAAYDWATDPGFA